MKKKLILLAISFFSIAGFAQSQEKALKQYGFWDNWFIQGQAGIGYTIGEPDFDKLISPTAALSIGEVFHTICWYAFTSWRMARQSRMELERQQL